MENEKQRSLKFVKVVDKDGRLIMYATSFFPLKERNSKAYKESIKLLKPNELQLHVFDRRTK